MGRAMKAVGGWVMVGLLARGAPSLAGSNTAARRPFAPTRAEQPVLNGVAYGPFRDGQRPGGPNPSGEQILEDLQLLAPHFGMIRMYSAMEPTETVLKTIAAHDLPLSVMVGVWLAPEADAANAHEVQEAIRLANTYPAQVIAVAVGNETQVAWSSHRSAPEGLIAALRTVRSAVTQPVTTSDDYNFWNKPEAKDVAAEVDFVCLHAYAMWNQQPLDNAVAWTASIHQSIAARFHDMPVVMCESGWATALNPEGREVAHVKAPAGEAEQARFYAAYTAWARQAQVPYFYFEAFDEPWKGSEDPREIEKHWGLFHVDRRPKAVLTERP